MEYGRVGTRWRNWERERVWFRETEKWRNGEMDGVPVERSAMIFRLGIELGMVDEVEADVAVSPRATGVGVEPLGHHAEAGVPGFGIRREGKVRGDEMEGGGVRAEMGEGGPERVS
jgi:hypothetical protein